MKAVLEKYMGSVEEPPWLAGNIEEERQKSMENYFSYRCWVDEEYEVRGHVMCIALLAP